MTSFMVGAILQKLMGEVSLISSIMSERSFYLLEGEGGGSDGGGTTKGEKQEGGAGKAGDQVSEQISGVGTVHTRNLGAWILT